MFGWIRTRVVLSFLLSDYAWGSGKVYFQSIDITIMKTIPLKSLHGDACLNMVFKINETKEVFPVTFGGFRDESCTKKPWERPEDVTHFSFSCITRNSLWLDRQRKDKTLHFEECRTVSNLHFLVFCSFLWLNSSKRLLKKPIMFEFGCCMPVNSGG